MNLLRLKQATAVLMGRARAAPFRRSLERPEVPLSAFTDEEMQIFGVQKTAAGIAVTPETALRIAAVWRSVSLISRDVAKLPLFVYRRVGDGKERDTEHSAFGAIRRKANRNTTSLHFRMTLQAHALMGGNGYAAINRSRRFGLELIILNPTSTKPVIDGDGRLTYLTRIRERDFVLQPSSVIHIKGLGDGIEGTSVISKARDSLSLSLAAERYGGRFFANDARPGVVLQHPEKLSEDAQIRLKERWNRAHQGIDNAWATAVLEEGMTANFLGMANQDAQFLETRDFQIRDVANWFGVPPHLVGDPTRTSHNSLESERQSYLDQSLDPWLVVWEDEFNDKLLTEEEKESESHRVEFERKALVRADLKTRGEFYNLGINGGWLNRDEVRGAENMNPLPDGEGQVFLKPMNMEEAGEDDEEEDVEEATSGNDEAVAQGDDDDRLAASKVVAPVLRDAVARMASRLAGMAKTAAKKPTKFPDFVRELEADDTFRAAIGPAIVLAEHLDVDLRSEDVETTFFVKAMEKLDPCCDSTVGQLERRVSKASDWIRAELAAFVLREIFDEKD